MPGKKEQKICPYCGQPAKRVTCGSATCQIANKHEIDKRWYEENGHIYKKKR